MIKAMELANGYTIVGEFTGGHKDEHAGYWVRKPLRFSFGGTGLVPMPFPLMMPNDLDEPYFIDYKDILISPYTIESYWHEQHEAYFKERATAASGIVTIN